jgi:uncharacterized membrane protein YagU involved in acid resistance
MELTILGPVLISIVFGLVVAGVYYLIAGPWPTIRAWLAAAWVLACLCYIILFGIITIGR